MCMASQYALLTRDKVTREHLDPVIAELRQLKDSKAISSNAFYAMSDRFTPLMHPTIHGPWLLRNLSWVGSACLIISSLLTLSGDRGRSQRPALLVKGFKEDGMHG
jgi:hypothetical protein